MLTPKKHLDLDSSVLMVSSKILLALKETGIEKYDNLLLQLTQNNEKEITHVFLPALSFLYLLGLIEYHQEIDSLELCYEDNSNLH